MSFHFSFFAPHIALLGKMLSEISFFFVCPFFNNCRAVVSEKLRNMDSEKDKDNFINCQFKQAAQKELQIQIP